MGFDSLARLGSGPRITVAPPFCIRHHYCSCLICRSVAITKCPAILYSTPFALASHCLQPAHCFHSASIATSLPPRPGSTARGSPAATLWYTPKMKPTSTLNTQLSDTSNHRSWHNTTPRYGGDSHNGGGPSACSNCSPLHAGWNHRFGSRNRCLPLRLSPV